MPEDLPLWKQKYDIGALKASNDLGVDLERLEREGWDCLEPADLYRLKTWGICTQSAVGLHMFRIRIPGGLISSAQLVTLADLSATYADGGAHITNRQNLELHSVKSTDVRRVFEGIEATGLTTRSACGHTVRNVMGCSRTGVCADEAFDTRPTVESLHAFVLEHTETLNQRLPRRINISVAGCAGCMSHAQVNDVGFVATMHGEQPGYQVWAAGSLASQPMLSHLLFGFVPLDAVLAVAGAVIDVYCEHGFRDKPAKARLKHLVAAWGVERFRNEVLARMGPVSGLSIEATSLVVGGDRRAAGDLVGVTPQKQEGLVRIEARVILGDLTNEQMRLVSEIADTFSDGTIHLTPEQNLEFHHVAADEAATVTEVLAEIGLRAKGAGSLVDVQVCAGIEWCTWGVGDSRGLARSIESTLASIVEDLPDAEPMRVHISGCSHGCARHQAADIGLAAVSVREGNGEGFEFFGGGRLGADPIAGRRIGKVTLAETPETATTLLREFLTQREAGEDLVAFLDRTGRVVGSKAKAAAGSEQA